MLSPRSTKWEAVSGTRRDFGGEIDHEVMSRASGSVNRQSVSQKPQMPGRASKDKSEYDAEFSDEDE